MCKPAHGAGVEKSLSDGFALVRGGDVERLSVFGYGSAGDVDALLFEQADQSFVGIRFAAVFVVDELRDDGFDGALADAFVVAVRADGLCEEIA